jgi:hypothetical protein
MFVEFSLWPSRGGCSGVKDHSEGRDVLTTKKNSCFFRVGAIVVIVVTVK